MARIDVMCAGTVVADVFCDALTDLPPAGSLQVVEDIQFAAGGCAVNVAANIKRLGLGTAVIGRIGLDPAGEFVRTWLREREIDDTQLLATPEERTSKTVVLNIQGEDRRYLHERGANSSFHPRDIRLKEFPDARALYVGAYLSLRQFSSSELQRLFRDAKAVGLLTVLDVVIPHGRVNTLGDYEDVLPLVDLFVPNSDEAALLTGLTDPLEQALAFQALNPTGIVAITCGASGAVAASPRGNAAIGPYSIPAIDPSGSGDAFTAGFLVGCLEGWPLGECLKFAGALGASAASKKGCTTGVFDRTQAAEFMAANLPVSPAFERGQICRQ